MMWLDREFLRPNLGTLSAVSTQVTRQDLGFHRRFVPRDRYSWMGGALGLGTTG